MHEREPVEVFEERRPHLREIASRMLGSRADADDAVQETWLRLQRSDISEVDNLPGWLTTVTSRLCLDRLRARQARPETPTGDLPDGAATSDDPAREAVIADSVGRALVVVLDALSPAERVAFVLHDVFAIPFEQIAPILERSTEATTKLAGRARRRAQLRGADDPGDLAGRRRTVQAFLDAVRAGDMEALVAVLAPDAARHVDPLLLGAGQRPTVRGARAIADEARSFSAPARNAELAMLDGSPGAVVVDEGRLTLALTFSITGGLVESFEVIADPERLAGLVVEDAV